MYYYLKELNVNKGSINTGGEKARADFEQIWDELGFQALTVAYGNLDGMDRLSRQIHIYESMKAGFSKLKDGDVLFIQFPFQQTTVLCHQLFHHLEKNNIRYVILLHDLESVRHGKRVSTSLVRKVKTTITELETMKRASRIILHNPPMVQTLIDKGVRSDKLITMDIFDYLIPDYDPMERKGKLGKDKPVIIASNLRRHKSTYAYNLPSNCGFNLYGVDFSGQLPAGSRYFGAFPPDELPHIMRGSFGLVWDGESAETCTGIFGDYLRLNCPHKISLYLASGIPIAIWSQSARAEYIVKNKLGIAVDSLYDLRESIDKLSPEEYAEMAANAERIGMQLRAGRKTRAVTAQCLRSMGETVNFDVS